MVQQCVDLLPAGAARLEVDRSGDERSGFSLTIDITPRTAGAAAIGGGVDTYGEFSLTFGDIWLEGFGSDADITLEHLRQLLMATVRGRLYRRGVPGRPPDGRSSRTAAGSASAR